MAKRGSFGSYVFIKKGTTVNEKREFILTKYKHMFSSNTSLVSQF